MRIGRKVYIDKVTGNVHTVTGQSDGGAETTKERDFEIYTDLHMINPDTVEVIQLEYDEYPEDFQAGRLTRVDIATGDFHFTPFPSVENPAPSERLSLAEQISELRERDSQIQDDQLFIMEALANNGIL